MSKRGGLTHPDNLTDELEKLRNEALDIFNTNMKKEIEEAQRIRELADIIKLRIIWPSDYPDRFMCVVGTFNIKETVQNVFAYISEMYGKKGQWIRERGYLHLTGSEDHTLKSLLFLNGDTISLDCDKCTAFIIPEVNQ